MKMKFGALVTDGRGKIGGHVASKNRAGAYLRTKVTPVNPQTAAQQEARTRLGNLAQGWRNLTEAQREAWNAAVINYQRTDIFGDLKTPTGINLYQRLNNNLILSGNLPVLTPPAIVAPQAISALEVSAAIGDEEMEIAVSAAIAANNAVVVWATAPQSAGKNFFKSELRVIGVFETAAPTPLDIWGAYVAKFGVPTAGTKIAVAVEAISTVSGLKSVRSQVQTIVLP